MKITIIGCGNMGSSIVTSLISSKKIEGLKVIVFDEDQEKMQRLVLIGAQKAENAADAAREAEIIILAVKPKDMQEACKKIAYGIEEKVVISIAAGTKISNIREHLPKAYVVRAMPNLNSSAFYAYTALYSDDDGAKGPAQKIFSSIGIFDWVKKEETLDALTAISGAGPAYIFRFAKEQLAFAKEIGMEEDLAKRAIYHTIFGSAKVLIESPEDDLDGLIRRVASKGGVTQEVLKESETSGVWSGLKNAWRAGVEKSKDIG